MSRTTNAANKLLRTFAMQAEVLANMRRGGKQSMQIRHVHIHAGGQAVVGNVTSRPGAVGKGVRIMFIETNPSDCPCTCRLAAGPGRGIATHRRDAAGCTAGLRVAVGRGESAMAPTGAVGARRKPLQTGRCCGPGSKPRVVSLMGCEHGAQDYRGA